MQPVLDNLGISRVWGCELLTYIHVDGRRKISNVDFQEQSDFFFTMVVSSNLEKRAEAFKQARLDRGLPLKLLDIVDQNRRPYSRHLAAFVEQGRLKKREKSTPQAVERMQSTLRSLDRVERFLRGTRTLVHPILNTSHWYLKKALDFREMITEKFYRFAYKEANKNMAATRVVADRDDLYDNYQLEVIRSIHKYDSDKGILKSYLDFWLRHANTNSPFDHQRQFSYTIPSARRRALQKNNWNIGGATEYNLAHELDESVMENTPVEPTVLQHTDDDFRRKLACLGLDWDMKLALVVSGIDFPASELGNAVNKTAQRKV